ncbi:MAG: peptidase PmbA [Tenericutes bacterium ADurb.Bin239]|nr:metallopeptidase TldD-related protein [Bacillota bacterium]OQA79049.1 MAG: peptidase PmbA [Tenericutes bacterium ADurb.Bin239]
MNVKKFFALAQEKGLEAAELVIQANKTTEMSVYDASVERYNLSSSIKIMARGIYKGKMGFAMSEKDDKTTAQYLVAQIKMSAGVSESEDLSIIFEGSPRYRKKSFFNKKLATISESEKLESLFAIEKALKAGHPLINAVSMVGYSEQESDYKLYNSHSLKLGNKQNYYYYYTQVVAKDGDDVKSNFEVFFDNDYAKFSADGFVNKVVDDVIKKLGGSPCATKDYPVVFNPKMTASLLAAYLTNASAERVEKKTSLFANKLNERIASSKVTVFDAPLTNNLFYRYFDDEGVAKTNKPIIKNGVLQTFFHNLSTATKMGVAPTGHGRNTGGKISIGITNIALKPGRNDFNTLIKDIKEGVFINELMGLHSGLNAISGDFSLQAAGFMIRDGKLAEPVNLITVAGNLVKMFMDVKAVGNENELQLSSYITSSILVKSLKIAG